jgi:hypothetical protein
MVKQKTPGRMGKAELDKLIPKFKYYSCEYDVKIAQHILRLTDKTVLKLLAICATQNIYFNEPNNTNICTLNELQVKIQYLMPDKIDSNSLFEYRGREGFPLPPNRAGGSPAHGFPVDKVSRETGSLNKVG